MLNFTRDRRERDRRDEEEEAAKRKKANKLGPVPWGHLLMALIPVTLLAYYCTLAAPDRVPLPASVNVTFPAFTHLLEDVVVWCAHNPLGVLLVAVSLLVLGPILPIPTNRYYIGLTIVAWLALFAAYYSLSAPVDRLMKEVQDNLPTRR